MESAVQHAWLKEVLKVVPALWKARAFLVEKNAVKVDAISAQQLHVLKLAPRRQGAAYGRERVVPADEGSNLRRIRLRAPSGCGTIARPEIAFRGKIK